MDTEITRELVLGNSCCFRKGQNLLKRDWSSLALTPHDVPGTPTPSQVWDGARTWGKLNFGTDNTLHSTDGKDSGGRLGRIAIMFDSSSFV